VILDNTLMNNFTFVGFEVLTAVVMKSIIFWDTRRHIPEDDTF
jgi:hypothetical protein